MQSSGCQTPFKSVVYSSQNQRNSMHLSKGKLVLQGSQKQEPNLSYLKLVPSNQPVHLQGRHPLVLLYENTGDTFITWWGAILENKSCSTAINLITHIFFDVLRFHGFVRIICWVKSAKYKPGKETNKQINLISCHREVLIFLTCYICCLHKQKY